MEHKRTAWLSAAIFSVMMVSVAWASPLSGPGDAPITPVGDATPLGEAYMLIDHWGGTWYDAEKKPFDPDDGQLCWAAAASNMLKWGGWADAPGMNFPSSYEIFDYYAQHWSNTGGIMEYAWRWWFDGTNPAQGWPGWAQVTEPGGAFYPDLTFTDYYLRSWQQSNAMPAIDDFLRQGYGVTVAIYGGGSHALTVWGFNFDPDNPDQYYGVWVTDSDDDKTNPERIDRLRYYEVQLTDGRFYLQNFYGTYGTWYLSDVEGLARVPEPAVLITLMLGGFAILRRRAARHA
jgi:hypothetical protein